MLDAVYEVFEVIVILVKRINGTFLRGFLWVFMKNVIWIRAACTFGLRVSRIVLHVTVVVVLEGRVAKELNGKSLELDEYVLSPGKPLVVFQRFIVFWVEAALDRLSHRVHLLLVILEKLVLEGFQELLVVAIKPLTAKHFLEKGRIHGFLQWVFSAWGYWYLKGIEIYWSSLCFVK